MKVATNTSQVRKTKEQRKKRGTFDTQIKYALPWIIVAKQTSNIHSQYRHYTTYTHLHGISLNFRQRESLEAQGPTLCFLPSSSCMLSYLPTLPEFPGNQGKLAFVPVYRKSDNIYRIFENVRQHLFFVNF